jgi:hypothetical protein
MKRSIGFFTTALALLPTLAMAGDFDGSKPLICAPVSVIDCLRGDECLTGLPEEIDAPAFMRFDFRKKMIVGPKRSSEILLQEKTPEGMTLQGREDGYGWTIVIGAVHGDMTATLATRSRAIVMYGSCTPD